MMFLSVVLGNRLPPLWDEFMQRLPEVRDHLPGTCYGVVLPTGADSELLEYHAAVEVPETSVAALPRGMVRVVIPPATYAKFTHTGYARLIDHTVNYAYSTWLMNSGLRHSLGPDLEIYDARYDATAETSSFDYAIPVLDER